MPRDPVGCMCACDEISKLKEKAHNSFMQVMYVIIYFQVKSKIFTRKRFSNWRSIIDKGKGTKIKSTDARRMLWRKNANSWKLSFRKSSLNPLKKLIWTHLLLRILTLLPAVFKIRATNHLFMYWKLKYRISRNLSINKAYKKKLYRWRSNSENI